MKNLLLTASLVLLSMPLLAAGQSVDLPDSPSSSLTTDLTIVDPEPMAFGAAYERGGVAPAATRYLEPFSRVGIGADLSPLGIGIQGAIDLNQYFDARAQGNFFGYTTPQFTISGFQATADIHLASFTTSLDWYPFGSILRISPGIMLFNGSQVTGKSQIIPGTSFSFESTNYYAARANPVTGATPLAGNMRLGLNTNKPAFTITAGFGSFVPRSGHHWSLPTAIGVAFTGAPGINMAFTGWACLDEAQKNCSDVTDKNTVIGAKFNSDLNNELNKWRRDVQDVIVYPIISTSVVYSFNIR